MPEQFTGRVDISTEDSNLVTISLDGNRATIRVGGNGFIGEYIASDGSENNNITINGNGAIHIRDASGNNRVTITNDGELTISDNNDDPRIILNSNGEIRVIASNETTALEFLGQEGDLFIGDRTNAGRIFVRDNNDDRIPTITLNGQNGSLLLGKDGNGGTVAVRNNSGADAISLNGSNGEIIAGGNLGNINGDLYLRDEQGHNQIRLRAHNAAGYFGGNGKNGDIHLFNSDGDNDTIEQASITLNGSNGEIIAGGALANINGDLYLRDNQGVNQISLHASKAEGHFGGGGKEGNLFLYPEKGFNGDKFFASISLNANNGEIIAGGAGAEINGDLYLRDKQGQDRIRLTAHNANGYFGGNDEEGNIFLFNSEGDNHNRDQATIHIDGGRANIWAGGNGVDGDVVLRDADGNTRIHLDAQTGDIRLSGADCAEEFYIANGTETSPGTVLIIDNEVLTTSSVAYDSRVAGVISGAGSYKPGIILGSSFKDENKISLALIGKTYCKVDASYEKILPGDLITTSPTLGHAMKATDQSKSYGAIIGKALKGIDSGTGIIPIIITLQ